MNLASSVHALHVMMLELHLTLILVHVVVPLVEGLIHQYYFKRKRVTVASVGIYMLESKPNKIHPYLQVPAPAIHGKPASINII